MQNEAQDIQPAILHETQTKTKRTRTRTRTQTRTRANIKNILSIVSIDKIFYLTIIKGLIFFFLVGGYNLSFIFLTTGHTSPHSYA